MNNNNVNNIWATSWQTQQNDCAPSKDSDQPGHPPSLIRVFAVHMKKAWVLSYPLSAQWTVMTLIRPGGCPGWSESSQGVHSHFVGFVMRQPISLLIEIVVYLFKSMPEMSQFKSPKMTLLEQNFGKKNGLKLILKGCHQLFFSMKKWEGAFIGLNKVNSIEPTIIETTWWICFIFWVQLLLNQQEVLVHKPDCALCPSSACTLLLPNIGRAPMWCRYSLLYTCTVMILSFRTPKTFVVITLKFELCRFTID